MRFPTWLQLDQKRLGVWREALIQSALNPESQIVIEMLKSELVGTTTGKQL